jgi:hypothetical protein
MGLTRRSAAVDNRRKSILAWQDRFRDPALMVLLVMELCLVFLAAPLAAKQVPLAKPIVLTMVLVAVVILVMLSQRRGAIVALLLGLAGTFASFSLGSEWSPVAASVLRHGGNILTFSALTWVVSHAVYAPGHLPFTGCKVQSCCI